MIFPKDTNVPTLSSAKFSTEIGLEFSPLLRYEMLAADSRSLHNSNQTSVTVVLKLHGRCIIIGYNWTKRAADIVERRKMYMFCLEVPCRSLVL